MNAGLYTEDKRLIVPDEKLLVNYNPYKRETNISFTFYKRKHYNKVVYRWEDYEELLVEYLPNFEELPREEREVWHDKMIFDKLDQVKDYLYYFDGKNEFKVLIDSLLLSGCIFDARLAYMDFDGFVLNYFKEKVG